MRSLILRVNPLVLLTVGLSSLVGSFAIRDFRTGLVAAAVYAVAAIVLLPSWRFPLLCLGFTSIAALSIAYSTWRGGGHDEREAVTAAVRIVVLAWPGAVALGYMDPSRLTDYLAQSMHLPARFVAAFSAALQRFAGFHTSWQQLDRARRMRGFGPSRNPIATARYAADMSFGLLVNALRGASQSSIAMDARGFADAHDRTWAEPAPWTRLDLLGLGVAAGLGIVPVLASVLG
ncbi:MAG: energy-coupling factor transporter transmembrane protein EcfT [Actinomycetota bacterium]|nr:energy-coupling factor transporter transmembrane protein EcfT [Actinomycetota bacterium]